MFSISFITSYLVWLLVKTNQEPTGTHLSLLLSQATILQC